MSCRLEKLSLLSLSFMLISSYSISSALPLMLDYFKGYLPDQVELLISLPSFFVILTLLANGLLTRLFSERQIIVTGLLTMTVAGLVPFFVPYYLPILISRMFFGVGTGMINAKAISIISERFSG
ncbi:MFS transporter [Streptococcus gallolyticus]|nr:MFS transporter [Streptococcus gallolyticus]MBY5040971.1 MFS transporter [Streptococcus gallolyticus]